MKNLTCHHCGGKTKKNGFQKKTGKQMYKCLSKSCGKCMQREYAYLAKTPGVWRLFSRFRKISISIRGLAEFLEINEKTVAKWILKARNIQPKYNFPIGYSYNMDELHTYIENKQNKCCIAYGWNRDLHQPIGLNVRPLQALFPDKNLNAKTIRQSVISNWLNKRKLPLGNVQLMAGHKYPSSTERYLNRDAHSKRDLINRFHPMG